MVRKSKKGGRFIGCSGYPECKFALPLPPTGNIVATNKVCERHGLSHIKIMTGGKKPWELGCPQCNFEEWQKKKKEAAAAAGEATTGTATAPKKSAASTKSTAKKTPAMKAETATAEPGKPVKKATPKKVAPKKKTIEKAPEA
jgi:DNA topoisomerase-1